MSQTMPPADDPLIAAAGRRARAIESATTDEERAKRRPDRVPFGAQQQKLAYAAREGYHRHWFNDDPGRIERAKNAGYAHVIDPKTDAPAHTVVGVTRGGDPLIGYLMEIPIEWYREDMTAQEAGYRERIAQIEAGRPPGGPSGADASAQYVPKTGIRIDSGRR